MTTQTTTQFAGAAEAIDQLIDTAVILRQVFYANTDAAMTDQLFEIWDRAETTLSTAVAEYLQTMDGVEMTAPVAWVHRCGQIARLAGLTEAQVNDVCVTYDWGMGNDAQISEVNRMTNVELASWAAEICGYELN